MHNVRLECTPQLSRGKGLCRMLQKDQETVRAAGNRGALTTKVMALRQQLVVQARCCRVSAMGDKSWDVLIGFM